MPSHRNLMGKEPGASHFVRSKPLLQGLQGPAYEKNTLDRGAGYSNGPDGM